MSHRPALVFAIVVMACGEDPNSVDVYLQASKDAVCDFLVRCSYAPDRATCDASNAPRGNDELTLVDDVRAGTVLFSPSEAAICLAERREESCVFGGRHLDTSGACDRVFTGTIAVAGWRVLHSYVDIRRCR